MRASGLILTDKDIVDITKKADPEDRGEIDLGKFFIIIARRFRDLDPVVSMARKSFNKISKSNMVSGQDSIPLAALRGVLTTRGGEQFAEAEVEEFMKEVQLISDRKRSTISVKKLTHKVFPELEEEDVPEGSKKFDNAGISQKSDNSSSGKLYAR